MENITGWAKHHWPVVLAVGVGMILGYLYYAKVGCVTGTCLISSNPYISVIYGGILGYLVSVVFEGFRFGPKNGECGFGDKDQPGQPQGGGG